MHPFKHVRTGNPHPQFGVDANVNFKPINATRRIVWPEHYCIIGGGKTGMDAIVYLMENNIEEKILAG